MIAFGIDVVGEIDQRLVARNTSQVSADAQPAAPRMPTFASSTRAPSIAGDVDEAPHITRIT